MLLSSLTAFFLILVDELRERLSQRLSRSHQHNDTAFIDTEVAMYTSIIPQHLRRAVYNDHRHSDTQYDNLGKCYIGVAYFSAFFPRFLQSKVCS